MRARVVARGWAGDYDGEKRGKAAAG